eukprot:Amastigsp_a340004_160.p2 type:complete len:121 gc:universal Amastigsp_a340004_160:993-631(-)
MQVAQQRPRSRGLPLNCPRARKWHRAPSIDQRRTGRVRTLQANSADLRAAPRCRRRVSVLLKSMRRMRIMNTAQRFADTTVLRNHRCSGASQPDDVSRSSKRLVGIHFARGVHAGDVTAM